MSILARHLIRLLCFLQTGVFAVHVFGALNLYLDANFPPEHYGIYVQITVGSNIKCTSLQSPFKKGCVVWDEIRNFPVTVSLEFRNSRCILIKIQKGSYWWPVVIN